MSTPPRARIPLAAAALALALGACGREPVSYAGLDAPLDPAPILIGLAADTTGPRAEVGRALVEGFCSALRAEAPVRGRDLVAVVYDDASRAEGLRAAARRFETEHGVLIAVTGTAGPRGAALAAAAPRTVVVCAGCEAEGAPREASFALTPADASAPHEVGASTARWVVAALRRAGSVRPRDITAALRATPPPAGTTRAEGAAPPVDPTVFRPPLATKPAAAQPPR